MIFDKIVSLGSNCECAWNIHNHFGNDESYPFDWLIIPHSALVSVLNDRFKFFGAPENMEVVGGGKSVRCNRYNILHHHSFPRDGSDTISSHWINERENVYSKSQYLGAKFLASFATGVNLFVRNRSGNDDMLLRDDEDKKAGSQINLLSTLDAVFPDAVNYLLCVNIDNNDEHERIIHAATQNLGDVPSGDWRVSPLGWSTMFNEKSIYLRVDNL